MIEFRNKTMWIPEEERSVAAAGDANSVVRVFHLKRWTRDGIDLAGLLFRLDLLYTDSNGKDIAALDKEVNAEDIYLTWTVGSITSSHLGTCFANVRAYNEDGMVRWSSFQGDFYIESTVDGTQNKTGLSELEQLEKRVDEKTQSLDAAEVGRVAAEEIRQQNEESRKSAESTRERAEEERQNIFTESQAQRAETFATSQQNRAEAFTKSEKERTDSYQETEGNREKRFQDAMEEFALSKDELKAYAEKSKSYAVGGTGTRENEDRDNAMYYATLTAADREDAAGSAAAAKESEEEARRYAEGVKGISSLVVNGVEVPIEKGKATITTVTETEINEAVEALKTELQDTKARIARMERQVNENHFSVPLAADDGVILADDDGAPIMADWKFKEV